MCFAPWYKHQAPTELFTRISTSSSYGAVYSYLNAVNVSAPKEQNVYSFRAVLHGAPSGAPCALRRGINIKLLRSCLLVFQHQAPTELFIRISTLLTSLLQRSKMFIAFGPSYMALLAERNVLLRRAINIKLLRSCLLVSQRR